MDVRSTISTQIFGAGMVVAGLTFNKWFLEALLAPDGSIDSTRVIVGIGVLQLGLVAGGVWIIIKRPQAPMFGASALLIAGALVFALGLADWRLRFLHWSYRPDPRAYVAEFTNRVSRNFAADRSTGWRMREGHEFQWIIDGHSNTYRSNAQGFRANRDYDRSLRPAISLVGDSFTFGTGVDYEETFGALIEGRLRAGVTNNYALPGFGLDQMWMSVRHQALPAEPGLIVVAFIDEDLDRSMTAFRQGEGMNKPRFVRTKSGLREEVPADRPNALVRFLDAHSALWTAAVVISRRVARSYPTGEWWHLNAAVLDVIAADCGAQGVPVLFVRLP